MQFSIPSWLVSATGSALIVASTIVGTLLIRSNDALIDEKRLQIASLNEQFQKTWDGHNLANNRFASADILAGLIAQTTKDSQQKFLIPRGAKYLTDAIYTMRLSHSFSGTSQQIDSEIFEPDCTELQKNENLENTVKTLNDRLRGGNLSAYDTLVSVLDTERLFSACALRKLKMNMDVLQNERIQIESDTKFLQGVQIALNLLGLAIVLLKDFPIWRNNTKRARIT